MARPTKWTEDRKISVFEKIIERIANGESCRAILDNADRKDFPSRRVFIKWLHESKVLSTHYAHACEIRADALFDEILSIADNVGQDVIKNEDGVMVINHAIIQRDRLRVDARKWALAKMMPKKFGDKIQMESKVTEIKPIKLIRL